MNGYTSGTQALQGREVNHDPTPYRTQFPGLRRQATAETIYGLHDFAVEYAPRPEFEVLDNPILAELRHCTGTVPQNARWYLKLLDGDVYDWRVVPAEQINHAIRVLTKLAALA